MALQGKYEFGSLNIDNVTHWDITYYSSEYGTDVVGNASERTGEISEPFCRASRQYDSPLLNSNQGCGWKVLQYVGEEGSDSPNVLKVYKPVGATNIVIHGTYVDSDSRVTDTYIKMDFSSAKYRIFSSMIITVALSNRSSLPEIFEHVYTTSANISQFGMRSHEVQINGSNFNVSEHDYMSPIKGTINSYQIRAIPNYCNVSMTRTFQKFLIGGYQK